MVLETELARNGNLWNQNWLGIGLGGIEHIPAITSYDNFPGLLPTDINIAFLITLKRLKQLQIQTLCPGSNFPVGNCPGSVVRGNCSQEIVLCGSCPGGIALGYILPPIMNLCTPVLNGWDFCTIC